MEIALSCVGTLTTATNLIISYLTFHSNAGAAQNAWQFSLAACSISFSQKYAHRLNFSCKFLVTFHVHVNFWHHVFNWRSTSSEFAWMQHSKTSKHNYSFSMLPQCRLHWVLCPTSSWTWWYHASSKSFSSHQLSIFPTYLISCTQYRQIWTYRGALVFNSVW